jgi:hypothetical protein
MGTKSAGRNSGGLTLDAEFKVSLNFFWLETIHHVGGFQAD